MLYLRIKLKILLYKYLPIFYDVKLYYYNNLKITNATGENNGPFNKDDCLSKIQYNNYINFYKNFLQLYIENRTNLKRNSKLGKLGGKI